MFSGIVESVGTILNASAAPGVVRIAVSRPADFNDIKPGDSIAVDGVCLTLESFNQNEMNFALAAETLQVLGLQKTNTKELIGRKLNLERSLRVGDRIHGHLLAGHVDSLGELTNKRFEGESLFLELKVQKAILPYIWHKGSITINGVSLTINSLDEQSVSVCLIPETQKRTNLADLRLGQTVTIEPDSMARAMVRALQLQLTETQNGKQV